jgi:hypothetical protein
MIITNRARRIGRAAVAARYRSDKEKLSIMSGKSDDNPNVMDATRAAQMAMDELLPCLQIAEIALDQNNVAILQISASAIRKATRKE